MAAAKILVVDDDSNLLELARTRLEASGYAVVTVGEHETALNAAREGGFDLAIVDLRLADQDGMTWMEKLHAINAEMPVIILTGHASVEGAVEAMKRGAYTYLTKPFDPRELVLQIGRALESHQLATENQRLRGLLKEKYDFANIVAKSDKMQSLLEAVTRIAKSDSTVYIHGESGTGKELIARAIHRHSIWRAIARIRRLSRSTARRFPRRFWRASSSAMRRAPSPARSGAPKVSLPKPTKARCFSTRSATCR